MVAHLLWEQEAGGSSPPSPTGEMQLTGGAKQLMERPDLGRWGRHKARRASPTRPAAWTKLSSLGRDELDRDRLCRPTGFALYRVGTDAARLAADPDNMGLMVRATREAFRVLAACGRSSL